MRKLKVERRNDLKGEEILENGKRRKLTTIDRKTGEVKLTRFAKNNETKLTVYKSQPHLAVLQDMSRQLNLYKEEHGEYPETIKIPKIDGFKEFFKEGDLIPVGTNEAGETIHVPVEFIKQNKK